MDLLIFLFLSFVVSLVVRLYNRWQAWLVWGILVSVILIWIDYQSVGIMIMIFLASGLGFLGPELWQGIHQATIKIFSQPRNWLWFLFSIGIYYSFFYDQRLLSSFITLACVIFAFRLMFRGFFRRPK